MTRKLANKADDEVLATPQALGKVSNKRLRNFQICAWETFKQALGGLSYTPVSQSQWSDKENVNMSVFSFDDYALVGSEVDCAGSCISRLYCKRRGGGGGAFSDSRKGRKDPTPRD